MSKTRQELVLSNLLTHHTVYYRAHIVLFLLFPLICNADFVDSSISGSTSITSGTEFFDPSFPIELEYGVTFYLALYGSILTFNESLLVYALADYSGEGPLRGCLRCKPCKVADAVYVTPGLFEPRDPSAAPVYPTRSRRIITGYQRG